MILTRFVIPLLLLSVCTGGANAIERQEIERLYQANCASCHGARGEPDTSNPMFRQMGVIPANFQDALFASREPTSDFFMVIKFGGAAKGFSEMMPAFEGVLSDEQIWALAAYVKTLAGDQGYPSGDMNFVLPIRTKKAFPEDEVVWKFSYIDDAGGGTRDQFRNVLELEKRFLKNWQWSLEVRHSFDDAIDGGNGNIDQIEPGIKGVLYSDADRQFIISAGALMAIKTEERSASDEFIPLIAIGKGLGSAATLQGTLRANLPTDGFSDGNMEVSGVMHWTPSMWPQSIKPGLELVAAFPFERGPGAAREDFVQMSLIPQAQIGLNKRGQVMLNVGAELPLNETDRYDFKGFIYLIWDFADGGFLEGW